MLYTIIAYAFNNQIRFNKNGEYNMPFGRNKSSFNDKLRKNFINYVNTIKTQRTQFFNGSYDELPIELQNGDFVYVDPPYLNSTATYNEKDGWNRSDEEKLLGYLDKLDSCGVKWALSNNLKYNNDILSNWMTKYRVEHIGSKYGNCSYHKKDRSDDDEIVVVNY